MESDADFFVSNMRFMKISPSKLLKNLNFLCIRIDDDEM